jgi:hypothetical protein
MNISKLSDKELNRHIRVFLKHIPLHAKKLGLDLKRIEVLGKQYQAFSWALDIEENLSVYSQDMKLLIRKLRTPISEGISTLYYFDLPRPPVFVTESNMHSVFRGLVLDVKASGNYSPIIERDLGIERLSD